VVNLKSTYTTNRWSNKTSSPTVGRRGVDVIVKMNPVDAVTSGLYVVGTVASGFNVVDSVTSGVVGSTIYVKVK